jgi:hypothetical protein
MITFRDNIAGELAALGILATDPDILQQALDATRFRAVVDFNGTMQQTAMGWTAEKNFACLSGWLPIWVPASFLKIARHFSAGNQAPRKIQSRRDERTFCRPSRD